MKTDYGILLEDIDVNGHEFKKDTILRVWGTDAVTSIQPFFLENKLFKAMWYMIEDEHGKSIRKVCSSLFEGVDPDFLPNVFS
jgi:hypothetical protein